MSHYDPVQDPHCQNYFRRRDVQQLVEKTRAGRLTPASMPMLSRELECEKRVSDGNFVAQVLEMRSRPDYGGYSFEPLQTSCDAN